MPPRTGSGSLADTALHDKYRDHQSTSGGTEIYFLETTVVTCFLITSKGLHAHHTESRLHTAAADSRLPRDLWDTFRIAVHIETVEVLLEPARIFASRVAILAKSNFKNCQAMLTCVEGNDVTAAASPGVSGAGGGGASASSAGRGGVKVAGPTENPASPLPAAG